MRELCLDTETFCECNLKTHGLYNYFAHPSFEMLLLQYSFDGGPVEVVDLYHGEKVPPEILAAMTDPEVLKTSYNFAFEKGAIRRQFGIDIPLEQAECTLVKAGMLGLPMSLDGVGVALKTESQKIFIGKKLIRLFCMPCKPVKSNGMRTRNLPEHYPEEWAQFKDYGEVDVLTEMEIRNRIKFFSIPAIEKRLYILDQKINDCGVLADRVLIDQAISQSTVFVDRLLSEARELTQLENPKSVPQLLSWLQLEIDEEVTTLRAKAVHKLLQGKPSPVVRRVLEIRQQISKTSIKKYATIGRYMGTDGRVRGTLQFIGANRTWRWAGRGPQFQNLVKNEMPDIDLAREACRDQDLEHLEFLFGDVPKVLSQLIRTALIAGPGKTLVMSDFKQIEARVLSWFAQESWRLAVFNSSTDIYVTAAVAMFRVPVEQVTKSSVWRQKAKISELACIAENQLVLTDSGLVPIQEVTILHKVWDGIAFVQHAGVVFKGVRKVITYDGLTATTDHVVWIEGCNRSVYLGFAAACGARLRRSTPEIGGQMPELQKYTGEVRTYDIVNCGPNNRFTVSGVFVHNCGYQGSVGALRTMGAEEMGLTEEELPELVGRWRDANPKIVKFWYAVQDAAITCVQTREPQRLGKLTFYIEKGLLFIKLPSWRSLAYLKPTLKRNSNGYWSLSYFGVNQKTRQWQEIPTYGGKLVENIVQATSRDLLAEKMLAIDAAGYSIVFHVHDEAVVEVGEDFAETTVRSLNDIMAAPLSWTEGLPLGADTYFSPFYKKD